MPRRAPSVDERWKKCGSSVGLVGQSFPPRCGFRVDTATRWIKHPTSHALFTTFTQQNAQVYSRQLYGVNSSFSTLSTALIMIIIKIYLI